MSSALPSAASPPPAHSARQIFVASKQIGFSLLVGLFVLLVAASAWQRVFPDLRPSESAKSVQASSPAAAAAKTVTRIDLNRATEAELQAVRGIGPALARRIVAYRDEIGLFARVEDLEQVPGIGPKIMARLRQQVYVDGVPVAEVPVEPPASRKSLPSQPIDLNRASREELMRLPGIGPVRADSIIADRTRNGPFTRVESITRVAGIGEKTLEKLRPFVFVGEAP